MSRNARQPDWAKQHAKTRRDRFLYWAAFLLGSWQAKLLEWVERPVWRSFDGKVEPIDTLGSDHLLNIDRMVRTKGEETPPAVLREIQKRGLRRKSPGHVGWKRGGDDFEGRPDRRPE